MLVKYHRYGQGRARSHLNYHLGRNLDRKYARVLKGDPNLIEKLIDSLSFAWKYTAGVLAFEESNIPEADKFKIMEEFERVTFPNLDPSRYTILWIEHTDKGILELNFLIVNVDSQTGRSLTPYLHKIDKSRIDAWKDITNSEGNYADPKDPKRKQRYRPADNLPRDKEVIAKFANSHVQADIDLGLIKNRADIVKKLESLGFAVTRQINSAISIKLTNKYGRPLDVVPVRLLGSVYVHDFKAADLDPTKIAAAQALYDAQRGERLAATKVKLAERMEVKAASLLARYGSNRSATLDSNQPFADHPRIQEVIENDRIRDSIDAGNTAFDRAESSTATESRGADSTVDRAVASATADTAACDQWLRDISAGYAKNETDCDTLRRSGEKLRAESQTEFDVAHSKISERSIASRGKTERLANAIGAVVDWITAATETLHRLIQRQAKKSEPLISNIDSQVLLQQEPTAKEYDELKLAEIKLARSREREAREAWLATKTMAIEGGNAMNIVIAEFELKSRGLDWTGGGNIKGVERMRYYLDIPCTELHDKILRMQKEQWPKCVRELAAIEKWDSSRQALSNLGGEPDQPNIFSRTFINPTMSVKKLIAEADERRSVLQEVVKISIFEPKKTFNFSHVSETGDRVLDRRRPYENLSNDRTSVPDSTPTPKSPSKPEKRPHIDQNNDPTNM